MAPEFLAGMSAKVTPTNGSASFTGTLGQATLGQTSTNGSTTGVADYTYTPTGTNTARLVFNVISPPSTNHEGSDINLLTFKTGTSATYTNLNGGYGKITFSEATDLVPVALSSNTIHLVFPTNSGSLSLDYGNYIGTSSSSTNSGTYTYAPYSPTVGMLTTDQSEYFQLTFATATSGLVTRTKADGMVKIGTFTLK